MTDITNIDTYLNEVKKALGDHPEKDEIVQELKEHIFDYANQLSRNSKMELSVQEAFTIALQSMEDPSTMAKSFNIEPSQSTSTWMEPRSAVPEKKLSDRDFLFIGIIGFFVASVVLSILSWVDEITGINLETVNFIVYLIQFLLVIGLILAFLYYRNEQEFNAQLEKLREKFVKFHDEQTKDDKDGLSKIIEPHIEGLFEVIVSAVALIGVLHVSFIAQWTVFTDNWYNIGIFIFLFMTFLEFIQGTTKMIIGQIRLTRLFNAIILLINAVGSLILIVFYPFDIAGWFATFTDSGAITIRDLILRTTSNPDAMVSYLLGISVVFSVMSAIYNMVKFGNWKPSHQKSLTMSVSKEDSL